jgi:hypothetical protein
MGRSSSDADNILFKGLLRIHERNTTVYGDGLYACTCSASILLCTCNNVPHRYVRDRPLHYATAGNEVHRPKVLTEKNLILSGVWFTSE